MITLVAFGGVSSAFTVELNKVDLTVTTTATAISASQVFLRKRTSVLRRVLGKFVVRKRGTTGVPLP
jgi:hypothetical protein